MRFIKCFSVTVDASYVTLLGAPTEQDTARCAVARLPLPRTASGPGAAPEKPERSPELAYMTLGRLRAYRDSLLVEELRVSYWRRIVQARRDLLRAGATEGDRDAIAAVLTGDRGRHGRRMMLALHPAAGPPVLPGLPELWALPVDVSDDDAAADLFVRLGEAESVLSSYREALHRRLNRATADLVARYHDEPRLCLVALPLAY